MRRLLFLCCGLAALALTLLALSPAQRTGVRREESAARTAQARWEDRSWRDTNTTHNPVINDIFFVTPDRGWALTFSQLFATDDGGKGWREVFGGREQYFFSALVFSDPGTGWIVGSAAVKGGFTMSVLHTGDGGRSWREQPVPGAVPSQLGGLSGISLCNSTVLWAAGEASILRTVDGGRNWSIKYTGVGNERLQDVVCVDAERAVAIGKEGRILYTQDGGNTWSRQSSGVNADLTRIRKFSDSIWIVGDKGAVLHAHVNNLKWESHQPTTTEPLYDVYVHDNQAWVVGGHGTILNTTDGGATWEKEESLSSLDLVSLYFIDPKRGWAGGAGLTLLEYLPL